MGRNDFTSESVTCAANAVHIFGEVTTKAEPDYAEAERAMSGSASRRKTRDCVLPKMKDKTVVFLGRLPFCDPKFRENCGLHKKRRNLKKGLDNLHFHDIINELSEVQMC